MMNDCDFRIVRLAAVAACLFVLWSCAGSEAMGDEVRQVGSRIEPFVDEWLIDRMEGTRLRLHHPVRREVVFRFDAPWEGGQSAYVTMLQEKNHLRMYYRGGGDLRREYTCVAMSRDGIHFNRPKLGLFKFEGSKQNNIIWTGEKKAYWESHNFSPFKDTNPATTAARRYKAVTVGRAILPGESDHRKVLMAFVSADGIHWKRLQERPIITEGGFDSQNVAFWDANLSKYVCYFRKGQQGKKSVARSTSEDFVHWSKPELMDFGGTPIEHFYTNGIEPYLRAPHLYLGFPMRFVHPTERNTVGFNRRKTDGLSDAVFMSSRDGHHWARTFMEAFLRPGLDPKNWGGAHGNQTPAWHIVQSGKGEMSIYYAEHYDNYPKDEVLPQMRRCTLRVDGFISVNAPYAGGEMVTKPLTFEGRELVINCATAAIGSVKVEVLDAGGKPIPGFTLDDAVEIWGDEIERVVGWKQGHDVSRLAGQPVRLRFVMKDTDLYSIQFRP